MNDIASLNWIAIVTVGLTGFLLTLSSFIFFNKSKGDEKDSLGVSLSERFSIVGLNGIFLLLGAIFVAIFKGLKIYRG